MRTALVSRAGLLGLATAAALALAPAAHAAPAAPAPPAPPAATPHATATLTAKQETVTARGTAPACIKRKGWPVPWSRTAVKITNKCGKTMRVRVIVKRGKDSPCKTLRKNKSFTWQLIPPYGSPSYHKTVTC